MTEQNQTDFTKESLGLRLKNSRELRRLSLSEAANRLRLSSHILSNLEKDNFQYFNHIIYLQGYVRSYACLLGFNDKELSWALEQLKEVNLTPLKTPSLFPITNKNYRATHWVRIVSLVVIGTLAILAALWCKNNLSKLTTHRIFIPTALASRAPLGHPTIKPPLPNATPSPTIASPVKDNSPAKTEDFSQLKMSLPEAGVE